MSRRDCQQIEVRPLVTELHDCKACNLPAGARDEHDAGFVANVCGHSRLRPGRLKSRFDQVTGHGRDSSCVGAACEDQIVPSHEPKDSACEAERAEFRFRKASYACASMRTIIGWLCAFLLSWLGWWLGAHVALWMAVILSAIAGAVGLYYGYRWFDQNLG